ncbi:MAG TPA: endolytic transglycosylase MltG [Baekduia sp.]
MSPLFGGNKGGDQPSGGGSRSAAEREAARLERERRRAEREGRPLPAEDVAVPSDGTGEMAEEVWAPEPAPYVPEPEAPEPVAYDPEPVAYEPEPVAYDPEPEPVVYEPPPVEPQYEVPFEPNYEHEPVTVPADAPDGDAEEQLEAPSGVRRVVSVADLPEVGGPRPSPRGPVRGPAGQRQRRPRRAPKPRGLPSGRGRRFGRRLVAVFFLLVAVAVAYFAYRVFQPGHDAGDAQRPVAVVIPQGATASEIADQLEHDGVVDSAFFFNLRSRLSGRRADLKAGRFTLKQDMSYTAALDALTQNPAAAPTVKVTIPEGRSIAEAAPLMRSAGLSGSYIKAATRNPRTVKGFKAYDVPKGTTSLEGFLFPATYELKKGAGTATAKAVVAQQLAAFKANFDKLDRRAAHRKHLTDYDVLIIASMIEREAEVPKDRRLISAVIYNRLQQHIPLGIDATLRYRLRNWTKPLKQSELQLDSAFNTRTHQGLPPTPIGSPGLASIKAALNPAKVGYLYYVVKPNGHGAHAFSSTAAQFQKDVDAYNKARAANGGNAP